MKRTSSVVLGTLLCGLNGAGALAGPPLPPSTFDNPLLALGAPAGAPGRRGRRSR